MPYHLISDVHEWINKISTVPISYLVKPHYLKFVGHCCQAEEEPISKVLLWMPQHGRRRCGWPALSYPKLLENDIGMMVGEIQSVMKDRDLQQQYVCERLK